MVLGVGFLASGRRCGAEGNVLVWADLGTRIDDARQGGCGKSVSCILYPVSCTLDGWTEKFPGAGAYGVDEQLIQGSPASKRGKHYHTHAR